MVWLTGTAQAYQVAKNRPIAGGRDARQFLLCSGLPAGLLDAKKNTTYITHSRRKELAWEATTRHRPTA
ncbi:hypothetical protein NVIE_1810 [Nitrososphaera viennensis EN76]|uniref:Uncharacterized protein n=1 Tax=Nitrososphaera viennensis EN76 TaxID=926571 RepID=A0A060HLC7_9ARCH|nr:hypothetical protein NVIE_1810 [Nitrososphaera viennensis EN76]